MNSTGGVHRASVEGSLQAEVGRCWWRCWGSRSGSELSSLGPADGAPSGVGRRTAAVRAVHQIVGTEGESRWFLSRASLVTSCQPCSMAVA